MTYCSVTGTADATKVPSRKLLKVILLTKEPICVKKVKSQVISVEGIKGKATASHSPFICKISLASDFVRIFLGKQSTGPHIDRGSKY